MAPTTTTILCGKGRKDWFFFLVVFVKYLCEWCLVPMDTLVYLMSQLSTVHDVRRSTWDSVIQALLMTYVICLSVQDFRTDLAMVNKCCKSAENEKENKSRKCVCLLVKRFWFGLFIVFKWTQKKKTKQNGDPIEWLWRRSRWAKYTRMFGTLLTV